MRTPASGTLFPGHLKKRQNSFSLVDLGLSVSNRLVRAHIAVNVWDRKQYFGGGG